MKWSELEEQSVISGTSFDPSSICLSISDKGDIVGSISTGALRLTFDFDVIGVRTLAEITSSSLFTFEDEDVEDEDSILLVFSFMFLRSFAGFAS